MVKTYTDSVKPVDMINLRHAHKIDDNHYKIYGRDGNPYIVFVYWDSFGIPHIMCPCYAGSHNAPCFHAAVVLRRLIREKKVG